ncbi:hypothetical protein SBOR_6149 [Sclerotinia borealis F-4128]|uniref:Secreted protein n=1 Tax=Sclerotinia borealis (strain F-4128) TaxID=1432307 RepID=W9CC79_SCLBF|nr:hypothetical protein SBOR_6149 [Sclerotinia borealis F-4128]
MKPSYVCLLALVAFFNPVATLVIPTNSTNHVQVNTTAATCFLSSSSSSFISSNADDKQNIEQAPPGHSRIKRHGQCAQKNKEKVKPRPCRHPGTGSCITQKEVDQGWHDKAGCFSETYWFAGWWPSHCWDAGDDCVKDDCRY